MSTTSNTSKKEGKLIIEPATLADWVCENTSVWQMAWQRPEQLATFTSQRGFTCMPETVRRLWGLGLLRADYVVSGERVEAPGLVLSEEGERLCLYRDEGADCDGDRLAISERRHDHDSLLHPYFHPFRYLVLLSLLRSMRTSFCWLPLPLGAAGEPEASIRRPARLELKNIRTLDELACAAIACEPPTFSMLFRSVRHSGGDSYESQLKKIDEHRQRLQPLIAAAGPMIVSEVHRQLCDQATRLDSNKEVHTLLRLGGPVLRLEAGGLLGGALIADAMAEMVRRAAEDALGQSFPEEDEVGYGRIFSDVKTEFYGGSRVRDAGTPSREYLRKHELDSAVRLRCYVEGPTEYGAYSALSIPAVEVIDLRGLVVERSTLAFLDSLRTDDARGIFSVVCLDADREDNIRAIRKAAAADEFCGLIVFSTPDFESANFEIPDMADALADLARDRGCDAPTCDAIQKLGESTNLSLADLFRAANDLAGNVGGERGRFGKNADWGRALMGVAFRSPNKRDGSRRPVRDTIDAILRLERCEYAPQRKDYRVESKTGQLVKREA